MSERPNDKNDPTVDRASRRARLLLLVAILLAVAAVIAVVFVVVGRGDDTTDGVTPTYTDVSTQVTSPYDVYELPSEAGPEDIKDPSLVSVSLPNDTGGTDYYGLSSGTEAAQAIIEAVRGADEVEAAQVEPTQATITFLLADRGTLVFDLYVEAAVVGRGGRYWLVDADLTALVQAAVSAGRP